MAQELAPDPAGISGGTPRNASSPREHSFNITASPPHWCTYTFAVYRYTQRAAVPVGAAEAPWQPTAPWAPKRWGHGPTWPWGGERQRLWTPVSRHRFHKALESEHRQAGTSSNIAPSSGFPKGAGGCRRAPPDQRQMRCWQACELEGSAQRKPPASPQAFAKPLQPQKGNWALVEVKVKFIQMEPAGGWGVRDGVRGGTAWPRDAGSLPRQRVGSSWGPVAGQGRGRWR